MQTRALTGTPPTLPAPMPAGEIVDLVLKSLEEGKKEILWDKKAKSVVSR